MDKRVMIFSNCEPQNSEFSHLTRGRFFPPKRKPIWTNWAVVSGAFLMLVSGMFGHFFHRRSVTSHIKSFLSKATVDRGLGPACSMSTVLNTTDLLHVGQTNSWLVYKIFPAQITRGHSQQKPRGPLHFMKYWLFFFRDPEISWLMFHNPHITGAGSIPSPFFPKLMMQTHNGTGDFPTWGFTFGTLKLVTWKADEIGGVPLENTLCVVISLFWIPSPTNWTTGLFMGSWHVSPQRNTVKYSQTPRIPSSVPHFLHIGRLSEVSVKNNLFQFKQGSFGFQVNTFCIKIKLGEWSTPNQWQLACSSKKVQNMAMNCDFFLLITRAHQPTNIQRMSTYLNTFLGTITHPTYGKEKIIFPATFQRGYVIVLWKVYSYMISTFASPIWVFP